METQSFRLCCTSVMLAFATLVSGCASNGSAIKRPTTKIAADDRLVPVNLALDAGAYVTTPEAEVAQHILDSVHGSGRFVRVETKAVGWPHTILIKYRWKPSHSAVEFVGTMVSAATLLIIPAPLTEEHSMKVEVLLHGVPVKEFSYSEQVKTSLSLFSNPVKDRNAATDRLLGRLYADLAASKIIPRAKDVFQRAKSTATKDESL